MHSEAENEEVFPNWTQELVEKYRASVAHAFILHGNVNDYVAANNTPLREFLAGGVFKNRSMIIFYDRSKGIHFLDPETKKEFFEMLSLGKSGGQNPAAREYARGRNNKDMLSNPNASFAPNPQDALPLIEEALLRPEMERQVLVFIEYPELLWAATDYAHMNESDRVALATILRWANDPAFSNAQNPIILATQVVSDLHGSLMAASNKLEAIEIPYPSTAERLEYIHYLLADTGLKLEPGMTPEGLAALTGGLSRVLIEDISLRALQTEKPLSTALVKERKDSIVESEFSGILEIIDAESGFDSVGGLEHVKDYLRRNVIRPLKGQASKQRASRGVLFTGPPGTGKTLMALALAKEAEVNFVKLNIGKLLNSYVGTSERNLELALNCIKSLKPTIVFLDEIDQQLQRGGVGDSGVSQRLFARILEAMSTIELGERGEVFWIAATNRIASVDSALRRQGRFDKIIPFIPGGPKERIQIIVAVAARNGAQLAFGKEKEEQASVVQKIAEATDGYAGSDLEGLCIKAIELAEDEEHSGIITPENFIYATEVLRPSTPPHEMEAMIMESIQYCNDLTLLPDDLRKRAIAAAKREREDAQQRAEKEGLTTTKRTPRTETG